MYEFLYEVVEAWLQSYPDINGFHLGCLSLDRIVLSWSCTPLLTDAVSFTTYFIFWCVWCYFLALFSLHYARGLGELLLEVSC